MDGWVSVIGNPSAKSTSDHGSSCLGTIFISVVGLFLSFTGHLPDCSQLLDST
jgi:hypothetical protein